jgi:hypothetical protein
VRLKENGGGLRLTSFAQADKDDRMAVWMNAENPKNLHCEAVRG